MKTTKNYALAPLFVDDHWDRDRGESDKEISRGKYRLVVELDVEGYRDLLSDADYYWDMHDEPYLREDGLDGLVRSAKRVLDVLLREGPPDGYRVERRGFSYAVIPM